MATVSDVLLLGSPYWCDYLQKMLNKHSDLSAHTLRGAGRWFLQRNKRVCLVGVGMPDTWKRRCYHLLARVPNALRVAGKPAIYWIGSDVLRLKSGSSALQQCINLAGSDWLTEEVTDLGYSCRTALFPVELDDGEAAALPTAEPLKVLCYVPDEHPQSHGADEILHAAQTCSDIEFSVVGGTGAWCKDVPDNLSFLGWVSDTRQKMNDSHVVLRRTPHDSLSAFVREALAARRHVIFSHRCPGALFAAPGDTAQLVAHLETLNAAKKAERLELNQVPADFINMLMDVTEQTRNLANGLR